MADDDDEIIQDESKAADSKKQHDSGKSDLEKVTDYAEEKEMTANATLSKETIKLVKEKQLREAEEKQKRERELAAVTVKDTDIDLIVKETELSRPAAERLLRENKGDLVSTFRSFFA